MYSAEGLGYLLVQVGVGDLANVARGADFSCGYTLTIPCMKARVAHGGSTPPDRF